MGESCWLSLLYSRRHAGEFIIHKEQQQQQQERVARRDVFIYIIISIIYIYSHIDSNQQSHRDNIHKSLSIHHGVICYVFISPGQLHPSIFYYYYFHIFFVPGEFPIFLFFLRLWSNANNKFPSKKFWDFSSFFSLSGGLFVTFEKEITHTAAAAGAAAAHMFAGG